jgi:hypothetical protein
MEEIYIVTHKRPDADSCFACALLKRKYKIIGYFFIAGIEEIENIKAKNLRFVDVGGKDLDHHQLKEELTSSDLVAKELQIEKEKWVQPLLKLIRRADLYARTQPFDIGQILKAISKQEEVNDKEIVEIGTKIAENLIEFYQKGMERDNKFTLKVVEEFFKEIDKDWELLKKYSENLKNPMFQRIGDLAEILTAEKEKNGEDKAKNFGKELLKYVFKDYKIYEEAREEFKKAKKIEMKKGFLLAFIKSKNPKISAAFRKEGANIIIQKNPETNNVQIYFDKEKIPEEVTQRITFDLRKREIQLIGKKLPKKNLKYENLSQKGKIEEDGGKWYYHAPDPGKAGIILNGSLTRPKVPPTLISEEEIIKIITEEIGKLVL